MDKAECVPLLSKPDAHPLSQDDDIGATISLSGGTSRQRFHTDVLEKNIFAN
jgi:hypothetical protein